MASLVTSVMALATTRYVPQEYSTITTALEVSVSNDTVVVDTGRYLESLIFPPLDIVLISTYWLNGDSAVISGTVIDASSSAESDTSSTLTLVEGQTRATLIGGFTLSGGHGLSFQQPGDERKWGGAIFMDGSSPRISSCRIRDNSCTNYPALYARGGCPLIENCEISQNCGEVGVVYIGYNLSSGDTAVFIGNDFHANYACGSPELILWDPGIISYQARLSVRLNRFHDYEGRQSLAIEFNQSRGEAVGNEFARIRANGFGTVLYASNYACLVQDNVFRDCDLVNGHSVNIAGGHDNLNPFHSTIERNWFENITDSLGAPSCVFLQFPNADVRENVFLSNRSLGSALAFSTWPPQGCRATVAANYFALNEPLNSQRRGAAIAAVGSGTVCDVTGNTFDGNLGSTIDLEVNGADYWDADSNYWGDPSGPYHPIENPEGLGDTVDVDIHVTPWLTEPPQSAPDLRDRLHLKPDEWSLDLPFPNPFNATTTIRLIAQKPQPIEVSVFNTLGRRVGTIWRGVLAKDSPTQVRWDGRDDRGVSVASGVYYVVAVPQGSSHSAPKTVKALLLR